MGNGNSTNGSAQISGPNGQPQGQQGPGFLANLKTKAANLLPGQTGQQPPPAGQPYNPGGGGKRRRHRKKAAKVGGGATTTLKKRIRKSGKTRKA